MSASCQKLGNSIDNFTAILSAASIEYHRLTRKSLDTHPLAAQLDTCQNPEAVSNLLQTQAQAFSKFRKGDERLMALLDPTVHILFTFSATLGEGIGLVSNLGLLHMTALGHPVLSRSHPQKQYLPELAFFSEYVFPQFLLTTLHDIQLLGREGCCSEPWCPYAPLRAHLLFPPTSEELHCDVIDGRIDGVTWEDYGAVTFDSCTFDQGDDREENQ
jgi:hypothetical protein